MEIDYKARYEALVAQINNDGGLGIYPMGHMSHEERDGDAIKKTDAYKCGWNDYALQHSGRLMEMVERADAGVSDDVTMLMASGDCFLNDDGSISLNMNDTWSWASSWCPNVPVDSVAEVARLFRYYGRAGLMYWHSCQEHNMRSDFHDNNRAIDFVRNEEQIRKETPDSNKRAYLQVEYIIGAPRIPSVALPGPPPAGSGRWARLMVRVQRLFRGDAQ